MITCLTNHFFRLLLLSFYPRCTYLQIDFVLLHLHLPNAAMMSSVDDGADGRCTTLRNKRHCTLRFWQLEPRKFNSCSKTLAEVTPTDVYIIRSRSVPRVLYPHAHFWVCVVYIPEGIKSVRSFKRGFLGPKQRNGQQEIPSFFSVCSSDIEHFYELAYYGYL